MIRYHTGALVINYPAGMLLMEMGKGIYKAPPEEMPQWHAAELETSGVMAWNPNLVRLERARKEMPKNPQWMPKRWQKESGSANSIVLDGYDIGLSFDHYEYSESGTVGNPLNASEDQGKRIFSRAVEHLSQIIVDVKGISIEVRNRDYWEV
jgi:creatinine amidohydrolase